ncbi:MAG TPA: hypothetical protein VFI31_22050 [Pirellulales bacterium]|nr:hypothetical protein [Pirellulales bacterium]
MKRTQAMVEWIAEASGGRTKPPPGLAAPAYSTEVRFIDGGPKWPSSEAWSLVVTKRRELGSEYRWLAEVQFLVKDAPEECLADGRTFELLEGNKCVVRGRILVEQDIASVLTGGTNTQI